METSEPGAAVLFHYYLSFQTLETGTQGLGALKNAAAALLQQISMQACLDLPSTI
jgi:hypothetical protein